MKIGIFIKNYAIGKKFSKSGVPNKSGAEFHCENHAKLLTEHGDSVYIMTKKTYFKTKAREFIDNIDVCRLRAPFRWLEIGIRLFTTHRNTECFYIVGVPKFAVWAILWAQYFKRPTTLVLTGKSEIFSRTDSWRYKILSSCSRYIAISEEIKQGLITKANIKPNNIFVLPQGVDTSRFVPVTAEGKRDLRIKYNLPEDSPVVLFCARIVINKGIDTMLEAWRIIHEEQPNAKLVVVGGGEHELVNEIAICSKELDNSIIQFGEVDKPDEFYRLADVYFFPSRFEGLPTTVMEALSSGLPCVTSDIGGCRDLVIPSKAGVLVDSENYEDFARVIIEVLNNETYRLQLSKFGREYAVSSLDCRQLLPRLRSILQGN